MSASSFPFFLREALIRHANACNTRSRPASLAPLLVPGPLYGKASIVVWSVLPLRFAKTHPLSFTWMRLITFSKKLLSLEKLPLCVSDFEFRHELRETTKTHVFTILAFKSFTGSQLSFRVFLFIFILFIQYLKHYPTGHKVLIKGFSRTGQMTRKKKNRSKNKQ